MTAFELNRFVIGPAQTCLKSIPDQTFQCCVTSPPYWGLRDYGARGQYGLEATPRLYVARMVRVFREVRRCLRDDGVLWLNLGDTYINAKGAAGGTDEKQSARRGFARPQDRPAPEGLKPKDLVGIPWRTALALQADGWWLRSEVVWLKPNAMPESVEDRPSKAHEHVFLLAKSRRYHFDSSAIAEPALRGSAGSSFVHGKTAISGLGRASRRDRAERDTRNARDVWSIPTSSYDGAHFATFPPELAGRCIAAGCPEGGAVLDPFFGSGTVGEVAEAMGRRWFGIELNPDYAPLIAQRTRQIGLSFVPQEARS